MWGDLGMGRIGPMDLMRSSVGFVQEGGYSEHLVACEDREATANASSAARK